MLFSAFGGAFVAGLVNQDRPYDGWDRDVRDQPQWYLNVEVTRTGWVIQHFYLEPAVVRRVWMRVEPDWPGFEGNHWDVTPLLAWPVFEVDRYLDTRGHVTLTSAGLPHWLLLSLLGLAVVLAAAPWKKRVNLGCPQCAYDWRATPGRCSECGFGWEGSAV
ncbi:MAG: hypothetical protein AAF743_10255 [Planctomycetota bacterium]